MYKKTINHLKSLTDDELIALISEIENDFLDDESLLRITCDLLYNKFSEPLFLQLVSLAGLELSKRYVILKETKEAFENGLKWLQGLDIDEDTTEKVI